MTSDAYVETWTPARTLLCLAVKARRSEGDHATLRRLHGELGNDAAAALAVAHRAEPIVAHGLSEAGIDQSLMKLWIVSPAPPGSVPVSGSSTTFSACVAVCKNPPESAEPRKA